MEIRPVETQDSQGANSLVAGKRSRIPFPPRTSPYCFITVSLKLEIRIACGSELLLITSTLYSRGSPRSRKEDERTSDMTTPGGISTAVGRPVPESEQPPRNKRGKMAP